LAKTFLTFKINRDKKLSKRKLFSKRKRKAVLRSIVGVSKLKQSHRFQLREYAIINAPKDFSFIEKTDETIHFILKLEGCLTRRKKVFVNLWQVENIDHSAVTVLLSILKLFKFKKIGFNGNYPVNKDARKLLLYSGFFKALYSKQNILTYTIGKPNQMFTKFNTKVIPQLGYFIMREIGLTIHKEKKSYKGMQRVLLELMMNTNNHAGIDKNGHEKWCLSVNHDKENKKVTFSFVDFGIGVFESLKNKPSNSHWASFGEIVKTKFGFIGNNQLLKLLLNGEIHRSVTGKPFRGKGIPGIKQVADKNQISNLYVITNDAYADVSNNVYSKLDTPFSGTFIAWEINAQNECLDWNKEWENIKL
jgi:hypothetical protein